MSTIKFYSDADCQVPVSASTGLPGEGEAGGECTHFGVATFGSFEVISLQRTCAVTIYNNDVAFCSSKIASVADLGVCYVNQTVDQFSVDCQNLSIAISEVPATTNSTTIPQSVDGATPAVSNQATVNVPESSAGSSDLSTGAKAGIGVGGVLVTLLIIALIAFLILRYRKGEDRAPNAEVVEVPENEKRYGLPEIEASEYKSNHELTAVTKLAAELRINAKVVAEMDAAGAPVPVELAGDSGCERLRDLDTDSEAGAR